MFVPASCFENASRGPGDIERFVFHTAEIDEGFDSAERIARFFAGIPHDAPPSKKVSAHTVSDANNLITCVKDQDVAFHALGDNADTLGHEFAARASMSAAEWRDRGSLRMLRLTAAHYAPKCVLHGVPPRWLTPDQERRRVRGFVSHKVVSDVFGEGIRSDPGPFFPYALFSEMVREEINKLSPAPTPPPARLPEWRVVVNGKIVHRETQKAGQRPTAWDRTCAWLASPAGDKAVRLEGVRGERPELVFKA